MSFNPRGPGMWQSSLSFVSWELPIRKVGWHMCSDVAQPGRDPMMSCLKGNYLPFTLASGFSSESNVSIPAEVGTCASFYTHPSHGKFLGTELSHKSPTWPQPSCSSVSPEWLPRGIQKARGRSGMCCLFDEWGNGLQRLWVKKEKLKLLVPRSFPSPSEMVASCLKQVLGPMVVFQWLNTTPLTSPLPRDPRRTEAYPKSLSHVG